MQKSKLKLSRGASELYDKYTAAIREGITNVSQLRARDVKPHSLSKSDFEKAYIEKLLGRIVSAVSADIRDLTDVLSKQTRAQVDEIASGTETAVITPTGNENIKEDTQE